MKDINTQIEEKDIHIDIVRKSQQGHMIVVTRKGCDKLKELQKLVTNKMEMGGGAWSKTASQATEDTEDDRHGCSVNDGGGVKMAITAVLGEDINGKIEVQPLTETDTGKKTTTIKAATEVAEKLIDMGYIKVVFNSCYRRGWVSIPVY